MKGQIEEQHGDDIGTVREAYKNGVNSSLLNMTVIATGFIQKVTCGLKSQGRGQSFGLKPNKGQKPVARRAEARGQKGQAGLGFLDRGSKPTPHQLGCLGEYSKLPQLGPGFEIWCNLRPQKSLQNAL